MGADTELNASFETVSRSVFSSLRRSIRELRISLLSEHTGIVDGPLYPLLGRTEGLVPFLDRIASTRLHRLREHTLQTVFDQSEFLKSLKPDFVWDPERPIEEDLHEMIASADQGFFARGMQLLSDFIGTTRGEPLDTRRAANEDDAERRMPALDERAPA